MNRLYWNTGFIFRKLKSNELSVGSGNTKSELKLTNWITLVESFAKGNIHVPAARFKKCLTFFQTDLTMFSQNATPANSVVHISKGFPASCLTLYSHIMVWLFWFSKCFFFFFFANYIFANKGYLKTFIHRHAKTINSVSKNQVVKYYLLLRSNERFFRSPK